MSDRQQQIERMRQVRTIPAAFRDALHAPGARGVVRLGPTLAGFQRKDFAAFDRSVVAICNGTKPDPVGLWIERTKGASKSSDASVNLLWLLWTAQRMLLIQLAASDADQAQEIRRSILAILRLPENRWITGLSVQADRIVNKKTGSTLEILTTDALSAHGARPDLLLIDEVSHISDWPFAETLLDNAAKMPHGGIWCLTNAGQQNTPAHAMREMVRLSPRWYFSKFDQPAPWLDAEAIAERRRISSPSRFNRLWRGVWTAESTDGLDPQQVGASVVLRGPHLDRRDGYEYFAGVDSAIRRDLFAVVTLGVNLARGKIELAGVKSWKSQGGQEIDLNECERYIKRLHERFGFRKVVIDPSHFWGNAQTLKKCGVPAEAEPITPGAHILFAEALMSGFAGHQIRLYEDPLVNDLLALEIEDHGSRYRVSADRSKTGHADRAFAFALALVPALDYLIHGEPVPPFSLGGEVNGARHGVQMGISNGMSLGPTGVPIQSRHGVRFAHKWDPNNRRVLN